MSAVAAAAGAAVVATYLAPGASAEWRPLRRVLGVSDRTASGTGFALTFDDGPHPQGTPAILDELSRRGLRATFFLVGEQVLANRSLAAEIAAEGHQIALHCHRHRNLLRLAPWQVRDDLLRAHAIITEATGAEIRLYRPPYGVLNGAALLLARRRGWRILLWSHWGCDWDARATPASIAKLLTDGAGDGSVLLAHDADHYASADSWRRTAAALPIVLDTLAQRGLQAVDP